MAWVGQCRVAFKTNADALFWAQTGKKSVRKILLRLSKESDIPLRTLQRWWEEEECAKNGADEQVSETSKEKEKEGGAARAARPICLRCKRNPVQLHGNTHKPYSVNSKYYGLCGWCRQKQHAIQVLDRQVDKMNGVMAVCPECNHVYYIDPGRINSNKKEAEQ